MEDFVQQALKKLNNEEIDQRVSKFFTIKKVDKERRRRHPHRAFGVMFPPQQVIVFE